jgi:hypothetical protein
MDGLLLGVGVGREVPVWLTVGLELIIIFGAVLGHPNEEALGLWLLGMVDGNVTGSDATLCVCSCRRVLCALSSSVKETKICSRLTYRLRDGGCHGHRLCSFSGSLCSVTSELCFPCDMTTKNTLLPFGHNMPLIGDPGTRKKSSLMLCCSTACSSRVGDGM